MSKNILAPIIIFTYRREIDELIESYGKRNTIYIHQNFFSKIEEQLLNSTIISYNGKNI
jgi:hypothetical protein